MKMRILWLALVLAMFSFACDDTKKTTDPPKTPETKKADTKPEAKKGEDTKTAEAPKAEEEDEDDIEFSDDEVETIAAEAAGEVTEENADALIAELEKELAKELAE